MTDSERNHWFSIMCGLTDCQLTALGNGLQTALKVSGREVDSMCDEKARCLLHEICLELDTRAHIQNQRDDVHHAAYLGSMEQKP